MATTVNHSIGTASRDYATLTLWFAALPASLVTADELWVGTCYNDSDFTDGTIFCSVTTDATRYWKLTVDPASRHNGTFATGARLISSADVSSYLFAFSSNYYILEWLNVESGAYVSSFGGSNAILRNFIYKANTVDHRYGISVVYGSISNVIIYGFNGASYYGLISGTTQNLPIKNVTIYNCAIGIECSFRYFEGINCICVENTVDFIAPYINANPSNNISTDSSAPGINSHTGITAASLFQNITSGSEDLRLKSTASAIGEGLNLGTADGVNIDIEGHTRPASGAWDIGADEFPVMAVAFRKTLSQLGTRIGSRQLIGA